MINFSEKVSFIWSVADIFTGNQFGDMLAEVTE